MIHLYIGDGKGKTTAAIGLCVRAAGRGKRVCFAQFMKGGETGELWGLKQISGVEILRSPREFGFYSSLSEDEKRALTDIHNQILDGLLRAAEGGCDILVMDEVTYPVNWKLLNQEKLKELLNLGRSMSKKRTVDGPELILTGRDAPVFLMEQADYITEMKSLRHPYEKGVQAREGIEY